ncbi:MAG: polyamine aminopropyltransferase [Gammaproteobacteria bacterium]|nr:MAG: polyamine aminopropyltransferase [Gammaproteobacteria bacterium]
MDRSQWFTEICEEGGSAFSMKIREKLHDEQTAFQRIEIYATEWFGNLMVIDGFVMLTARDNFIYHEMMAHPALFSHPSPENVVIIGGGDCGTLREVLKHARVTHVLQVEIDERVTRLAEEFFPELCVSNNDTRAEFFFGDGIRWMQTADPGNVDVILVDSTDPIGPAEGLYTEAFYANCHRVLGDSGVLVQQSESPLFHMDIINPMRKQMQAAGFADVQTLFFPQPSYPSGWWTATLAGKQPLSETYREQDAVHTHIKTSYYNAAVHQAALTAPEFFHKALE